LNGCARQAKTKTKATRTKTTTSEQCRCYNVNRSVEFIGGLIYRHTVLMRHALYLCDES
jgi:hypothetical protein